MMGRRPGESFRLQGMEDGLPAGWLQFMQPAHPAQRGLLADPAELAEQLLERVGVSRGQDAQRVEARHDDLLLVGREVDEHNRNRRLPFG